VAVHSSIPRDVKDAAPGQAAHKSEGIEKAASLVCHFCRPVVPNAMANSEDVFSDYPGLVQPFDSNGEMHHNTHRSGSGGLATGAQGHSLLWTFPDQIEKNASWLRLSLLYKFGKIVLPNGRSRMRAVSTRLIADGNQDEPAMRDALHQFLGDSEFRRIDVVIRRVNP
jgi:hypothetical protein